MFCSKCGKENNENVQVCIFCNTILQTSLPSGPLQPDSILKKRYKICEAVKKGGMGAVYKAIDISLNCTCAVKELLSAPFDKQEKQKKSQEWFEREAKILAKLDHPNLPAVTDYFVENNRYYLVMNFIEGKDLDTLLKEKGKTGLPEGKVLELGKEILKILVYLHNQKPPVIYRDIKPANIMLHKDGRAMLIDFGIARTLNEEDSHDRKTAIGTLSYIPPEQCTGHARTVSDIYSLGATMHHLLTGVKPGHFQFEFEPVRTLNPSLSPEVEEVIIKATKKDFKERFTCAEEMLKALENIKEEKKTGKSSSPLRKPAKFSFLYFLIPLIIILSVALYKIKDIYREKGNPAWIVQEAVTGEDVMDLYFTGRSEGFAVCSGGTLLHIKKSFMGKTLIDVKEYDFKDDLLSVAFSDRNNGWIAGNSGIIMHTEDGGKTWNRQDSETVTRFEGLYFIDNFRGWAAGTEWLENGRRKGVILYTENGGKNWSIQMREGEYWVNEIYFTDEKNGWTAGGKEIKIGENKYDYKGSILHTDDGGKNWKEQITGDVFQLNGIHFEDSLEGWACGSFGSLLHTDDGGVTWKKQDMDTSHDLMDIFFTDPSKGWIAVCTNEDSFIINTSDGGITWNKDMEGISRIITGLYFIDASNGWASGAKGSVIKYSH